MALGETTADRLSFLDETATYGTGTDATTIAGVFERGYAESQIGIVGIQGYAPMFMAERSQIDADPVGIALTVDGTGYTIIRAEPDGYGMVALILEAT